jgi:hypothetical protein
MKLTMKDQQFLLKIITFLYELDLSENFNLPKG